MQSNIAGIQINQSSFASTTISISIIDGSQKLAGLFGIVTDSAIADITERGIIPTEFFPYVIVAIEQDLRIGIDGEIQVKIESDYMVSIEQSFSVKIDKDFMVEVTHGV